MIAGLEHHIREGKFQRWLSLVVALASTLSGAEVLYEHYRGSYSQRVMYTPVILSPLLTLISLASLFSRWSARRLLPLVSFVTMLDGLVGFVFHVRGIQRKPGGWRLPVVNLIMGPPVFAPLLFATSGFLGAIASFLRRGDDPEHSVYPFVPRPRPIWEQDIREGRFQQGLAAAAGVSALFSGIEAWYSHYRNNFGYPRLQWSPIVLTPLLMIAGFGAVRSKTLARTLLPAVSLLAMADGTLGTFWHLRGIGRRPGGYQLLGHNIIYGPPAFAQLLFASSGFLGFMASLLRRS
jgi:hypothetical protein